MTVASDGEVRPCSHLDVSYGNLFKEELKEIWTRMNSWRDGVYLPTVCRSCKLLPACGGGCRMEAKMHNGSLSTMDPYCSPENVESSLISLQEHRRRLANKKPVEAFEIKHYRYRSESFGVTVLTGKSRAFLNDVGFELLKQFEVGIQYSSKDRRIQWGTLDSTSFIQSLVQKGIAIEK